MLGTHSTGKTTLLKRIETQLRAHGVAVARTGRIAKRAAGIGLPKMTQHTAASTEWITAQGIADEIAAATTADAEVVLADRAPLDALAYLHAALEYRGEHLDRLESERLRLLVATQLPKYDLLLATVLDESVPVDESHTYDARYRRLVDRHVHQLLTDDAIPHHRVTSDHDGQSRAVERALELCLRGAVL
ncbi:AAA family ATPase [Streptomyces sp. NPDC127108]|uniref:AAA family ATPase n=1 Tax=Streptomyces sp. NPDC127108 TaxID=3345361 RepID=UPI00362FBF55